jgi:MoxR-like ATPase
MLQFMESETASRFHDPCLQSELDLRHVSIIATANETDRLPRPLLDRFRVIQFPKPEARHLEALIPDILQTIAADQRLDPRFFQPLDQIEVSIHVDGRAGRSVP